MMKQKITSPFLSIFYGKNNKCILFSDEGLASPQYKTEIKEIPTYNISPKWETDIVLFLVYKCLFYNVIYTYIYNCKNCSVN